MVYNEYIKCEVCGKITRIRLQVGRQKEHPIAVTCGECGISLKGKVFIGQDAPSLKFEFENAEEIDYTDTPDYAVECSSEFTTLKMCEGIDLQDEYITPFLRFQEKLSGFEEYEKFAKSMSSLMRTISAWPQYKRVLQLSKAGNREYLLQEIKKLFPEDLVMCRDEFEIMRAVRLVEVSGFLSPLKPEIIQLPEIGSSILQLNSEEMEVLIDFLNEHEGYSLSEMQDMVNVVLDEFVDTFQYLVPAFSLQFCEEKLIDFEKEGTTTSTYADVKQFYLDVYETLGNLLIIPAAFDNIRYRKNVNKFADNDAGIASLDKFIGATKANRFHLCNSNEVYMRTLDVKYNQKLRNAIGHNDVEYDNVTQQITYIPDPKKRNKKLTEYLLKFEMEALSMFQAILVISEYLYRLRELELIKKGVIPHYADLANRGVRREKIYPNEKCPCGSGKKYKHCHGKI